MADVPVPVTAFPAVRLIRPEMGRTAVAVNLLYALALTVAAMVPRTPSMGVSVSDKTLHVCAYAVAGALMWWMFRIRRSGNLAWLSAVASTTVLGLWTEVLQLVAPERSFQWGDLVADGVGAILGATVAMVLVRGDGTR